MFSKLAFFSVVSMAVFVAASPSLGAHPVPVDDAAIKQSSDHVARGSSKCNTGPVQCCNAVYESNSEETNFIQSFMGGADVVANGGGGGGGNNPPAGMMASSCSPVSTGDGGASSTCTGQTVCCKDNDYKGFLAFGCSPVNFFD